MNKRYIFLYYLAFVGLLSCIASAEIIKSGSLQATSDGLSITLRWMTENETNVAYFEVERSADNKGSFVSVVTIDPKGSSLYEFVDHSALRRTTTVYQYRIKIVFSNGVPPIYSEIKTVDHNVSGIRRTWGSIKAMFR